MKQMKHMKQMKQSKKLINREQLVHDMLVTKKTLVSRIPDEATWCQIL